MGTGSPIENLPAELLAYIFSAGCRDAAIPVHQLPFPVLVSHVSHQWRDVALSTPGIWSFMWTHMDETRTGRSDYDRLQVYRDRSGSQMVDIRITCLDYDESDDDDSDEDGGFDPESHRVEPPSSMFIQVVDLLIAQAPRWRSLVVDISGSRRDFAYVRRPLAQAISRKALGLEYLHVCCRCSRISPFFRSTEEESAEPDRVDRPLRIARLSTWCHLFWAVPTLAQLVELEVHFDETYDVPISFSKCYDLLSRAPKLERLVIEGGVDFRNPPAEPSAKRLAMPHLRTLAISSGLHSTQRPLMHLLLILDAPRLEELHIDGERIADVLSKLIARPSVAFPNVKRLQFSSIMRTLNSLIITAFPAVELFISRWNKVNYLLSLLGNEAVGPSGRTHDDSSTLAVGDDAQNSVTTSPPWPFLKALSMRGSNAERLLEFARARQRLGCPLDVLYTDLPLSGNPSDYESPPQRHDVRRLREIVRLEPIPHAFDIPYRRHLRWSVDEPGPVLREEIEEEDLAVV